jgi:hypothetical protein
MATLEDAESAPLPDGVPRALATNAVVRCRDLLGDLLRQIVLDGGPGTRISGYGLYELLHAVGDSFSGSHAERGEDASISYLRVWKPIEKLAHLPTERARKIPPSAYHGWNDHRDKTFVEEEKVVSGRRCEELVAFPYEVPFECLSPAGDLSRRALVELLVVVRDLRAAHLAAPHPDEAPEESAAWTVWRDRWFRPAHACEGAACAERQPAEEIAGGDAIIGLGVRRNASATFTDAFAFGSLIRSTEALNPFVYALGAELGYRHENGTGAGLFGLRLDLLLPVGKKAALGLTPMTWRTAFGSGGSGPQLVTQLLQFHYQVGARTWLSLHAPVEFDWIRARAEWTFALAVGQALGKAGVAGGPLIRHHADKVERRDETWVPPTAPYGRLQGRRPAVYAASGITTVTPPDDRVEGRRYGLGFLGGDVMWDRDRWGGRFAWVPSASLAVGARATSGESSYVTFILAGSVRWYALGPFGLSLTPVRVEGGPKVAGRTDADSAPGVHGTGRDQYYLEAGSRLGLAFNAGIVDVLIEAPTLAWRSSPFSAGEVLSARVAIRLN